MGIIYDRYGDRVYGLAYKLLKNPVEAEDLTQEAFLALYEKDTYQPERGSLIAFLLTWTRSRALDKLRSRNIKQRFLQRWQSIARINQNNFNSIEEAVVNEQAELILEAMARLPEAEKQVLVLAYYEYLTQAEIAKHLNIPLGTVKSRSRQGLAKLRQALGKLGA